MFGLSNNMTQAILGIVAGFVLVLLIMRRRKRKMQG
jgi:LPXTG-motif cell wall-anchored protein